MPKGVAWKLVSSDLARRHLLWLSGLGVGRTSVADACDLSYITVKRIRQGRTRRILPETERRILNVTPEAFAGGSQIPAGRTWLQIRTLLAEGFTKRELAKRMGYAKPELRMGRKLVTGTTAVRVDKFYRKIMAGAE